MVPQVQPITKMRCRIVIYPWVGGIPSSRRRYLRLCARTDLRGVGNRFPRCGEQGVIRQIQSEHRLTLTYRHLVGTGRSYELGAVYRLITHYYPELSFPIISRA